MKKQDEIAGLIGGTRHEADQFVQQVNVALSERATLSEILHALRRLPPEKRKPDEVIIALGGTPQIIRTPVVKAPTPVERVKPESRPRAPLVITSPPKSAPEVQAANSAREPKLSPTIMTKSTRKETNHMANHITPKTEAEFSLVDVVLNTMRNATPSSPAAARMQQEYLQAHAARERLQNRFSAPEALKPQPAPDETREHNITESNANWWYQQMRAANPKGGPREIHASVVGVTYENRQAVVAQLTVGEQVWLPREPQNPYDSNAIRVERQNGQQIGYLSREFAASLAPQFDEYGKPVPAFVTNIVGGTYASSALGVRIRFAVPNIAPQSLPTVDDIDDYYDL